MVPKHYIGGLWHPPWRTVPPTSASQNCCLSVHH